LLHYSVPAYFLNKLSRELVCCLCILIRITHNSVYFYRKGWTGTIFSLIIHEEKNERNLDRQGVCTCIWYKILLGLELTLISSFSQNIIHIFKIIVRIWTFSSRQIITCTGYIYSMLYKRYDTSCLSIYQALMTAYNNKMWKNSLGKHQFFFFKTVLIRKPRSW
jgi:hypothetical protein